jgi:hypothetical protein
VTGRAAWLNTPLDRRVPSSLEPYALALLQEGPWYKGACPQPDISGCGECRIALKGSALETIGNGRTSVTAMQHGQHYCRSARAFAVNPSRLKARPLRASGG